MQNVNIVAVGEKVEIFIDGVQLKGIHSFSLDYVEGYPLRFSCVADIGKPEKQDRVLH